MEPKRIIFKDKKILHSLQWTKFTVDDFVDAIRKQEEAFKINHKYCDKQEVTIELGEEWGHGGDSDAILEMEFIGSRLETPAETEARSKRSKSAKIAARKRNEKKEADERVLLQKLKDKYE